MFYSQSTGGFYDPVIHGSDIPPDAVAITKSEHEALIKGQAGGLRIVAGPDGFPVLAQPVAPSAEDAIKHQILALEATITPRRMREAVLGADGGWLAAVDQQIAALRAQLA